MTAAPPETKLDAFLAFVRDAVDKYGSERAAAKVLGVSHASLNLWLKGQQNPAALTIRAFLPHLYK